MSDIRFRDLHQIDSNVLEQCLQRNAYVANEVRVGNDQVARIASGCTLIASALAVSADESCGPKSPVRGEPTNVSIHIPFTLDPFETFIGIRVA